MGTPRESAVLLHQGADRRSAPPRGFRGEITRRRARAANNRASGAMPYPSPEWGGSASIEQSEMRAGVGTLFVKTPPGRSLHSRPPSPCRGGRRKSGCLKIESIVAALARGLDSCAMHAPAKASGLRIRRGEAADLDALLALENTAFTVNRLTRRGFRRLLAVQSAALLVAEEKGAFAGYALTFFRRNSAIGRLYSVAVVPAAAGRGIGQRLLEASEKA